VTTRAGVIGRPVAHSLSPVIHNAGFAALGLDWTYEAFDVGDDEVADFVTRAAAEGFGGLNVTMPDKAAAAVAVDQLSPDALALGAVNTVVFERAGGATTTVGHNTDGAGYLDALAEEAPELSVPGCRVAVVGAGGAARSVVLALGRAGAGEIVVVNRTPSRAEAAVALAADVARSGEPADLADADLVVNATPIGMGDGGPDALPFDADLVHAGQVVHDLIYWPAETPLLRAAARRGARALNGLGMLVHQAARSFRLWTGQDAPLDAMREAVELELGRRS
jgi:shikimate dehydrogenase